MKKIVQSIVVLAVLLLPVIALAQSPTQAEPGWFLRSATPFGITVSVLSFLVSVGTAVQNAGKLFGTYQVPTKVILALVVVVPFLSDAVDSLRAAGALDFVSVWNAFMFGVMAVGANLVPQAVKIAHVDVPAIHAALKRLQPPAN